MHEFLSLYQDVIDEQGRQCVVRNGYLPARQIMTGLGEVDIRVPKTRDRGGEGRHFRSGLLPPYIQTDQECRECPALAVPEGNIHR